MDVRSEEGTIMLEWGIGMIFSIFILMFFLALSVHLYQRNMFTAACNAAVVRVAENYKYEGLEYKEEITARTFSYTEMRKRVDFWDLDLRSTVVEMVAVRKR